MVKYYICEKCGSEFNQKSHYNKHLTRKTPCFNEHHNLKKLIKEIVVEQIKNLKVENNLSEENQDTGLSRNSNKEQFYTNNNIAKSCIASIVDKFPETKKYRWIEPSAGNGSFYYNVPENCEVLGIDIDPKSPDIKKNDFLTWDIPSSDKNTIIFGNPPFGRQSTTAKKFIKKACLNSDIIAFILPKSFMKPSMNNVFNEYYQCKHQVLLEKNSFILNKKMFDVPCIFQIWVKSDVCRKPHVKHIEDGFKYVKPNDNFDIAFRRVGGKAGQCFIEKENNYNSQSHHFIKLDNKHIINLNIIVDKINNHIFPSNTLGPRSLSKSEINEVINGILTKY